jgi:hypothetical protein
MEPQQPMAPMPNAQQTIMKILALIEHNVEREDLAVPIQVQAIRDLATAVNTLSMAVSQSSVSKDKIELAKLQVQAAVHDGNKKTATAPQKGS